MIKKNTKAMKRLVRQLQELRGCAYSAALNELRSLPEGTWRPYIERIREQQASGTSLEPKDGRR